jgi:hypothetical protein
MSDPFWIVTWIGVGLLTCWLGFVLILLLLRKKKRSGGKEPEPGPTEHPPAAKKDDHGSHGHGESNDHDDHGHRKKNPVVQLLSSIGAGLLSGILIAAVAIAVITAGYWVLKILISMFSGPAPGLSSFEEKQEVAAQGTMPDAGSRPGTKQVISGQRTRIMAPASDDSWAEIPHVRGYDVFVCEADERLRCTSTETDPARVPYAIRCRVYDGAVIPWSPECSDSATTLLQARGDTPIRLAYWHEPK